MAGIDLSERYERPNLFKRIMNRVFNWFSADFAQYERDTAAQSQYESDLAEHEAKVDAVNKRYEKNASESRRLQEDMEKGGSSRTSQAADPELDVAMDFNTFSKGKTSDAKVTTRPRGFSLSAEKHPP